YDPVRRVTVMFGGSSALGDFGETWEWDGTNWSRRSPETSPPARSGHGMVYDSTRHRVVLYGGAAGLLHPLDDMWGWDGVTWTERMVTSGRPPPRTKAGVAYDSGRDRLVVYGGQDSEFRDLDDMWEFDGSQWLAQLGQTQPGKRSGVMLAYDSKRKRTVLF